MTDLNVGDDRPAVVSLFAGGGGLTLGFLQSGFNILFATDINDAAAATFAKNLPQVPFHHGDIRRLGPSRVKELVQGRRVDIIVGGPPCQGFSTLGDQTQGDPRNSLYESFARVVRWTQPRCVLMENTSYLRSQYNGRYEHEIEAIFASLGYDVQINTLNAADFGTPQIRKRAFFVATRLANSFEWPRATYSPIHSLGLRPYRTVGEAIMDIADAGTPSAIPNHMVLKHSEVVLRRYALIPEGGRLPPPQSLPPDIRRRNFGNTYKRLHRARPSLTLVPGNNAFPVHPTEDRSLTPREAARLQDFPDSYVFEGTRAEQCKLVGNAVPVRLGNALAISVRSHLDGLTSSSESSPVLQLNLPLNTPLVVAETKGRRQQGLSAVSFYTGAGGLLLGFTRAGFDVRASYDRKSIVDKNVAINFPGLSHFHKDVSDLTDVEVLRALGGKRPDVIFGGSPCQGFSVFGNRRFVNTRGHNPDRDPRNELTIKFMEIAIKLQPRAILLENVKGMRSTPRGRSTYLDVVLKRLEAAGYNASCKLINCADYGVPQLRERLIVVATRPEIDFVWPSAKFFADPKPWQRAYTTVGDVISDLEDAETIDAALSHVPMQHKELLVRRYELIPEGGKLPDKDLSADLRKGYRSDNIRNYSHVYRRLARNRPARTMVPGHNAFPIHPTLPRALTVREAARIQTFPDAFRFVGTRQQQCMLVGNAVPPLLAEQFAQALSRAIRANSKRPGYKADHYELKAAR